MTYNSAECVKECLVSLRTTLPGAHIVVVDNGSTDATLAEVRSHAPDALILAGHGNVGYGQACNIAAAAVECSHLLLLNPDVRLEAADAEGLALLWKARPLGIVAPLLAGQGSSTPRHQVFRRRGWFREAIEHGLGPLIPREVARPRRPSRKWGQTAWASGAMLLVNREEFQAVGGFDPSFFLYYDDQDLCRRYVQSGLPIRTTTVLQGAHAGGKSSPGSTGSGAALRISVLGWIEYLDRWEGRATAERAARLALGLVRASDVLLRAAALARPRSLRVARKRRQVAELWSGLGETAHASPPPVGRHYPNARQILKRVH